MDIFEWKLLICVYGIGLIGILIYIGIRDFLYHKIGNKACLLLLLYVLCGMAVRAALQTDFCWSRVILEHISGVFVISVPMFLLAIKKPGSFGGGDVKLMAVCGGLLGYKGICQAFCISVFLAGIYACILLLKGKGKKTQFALGPFLCSGVILVFVLGG